MSQRIRTSLQNAPKAPMGEAEQQDMRRRAWLEQELPIIPLSKVYDEWLRQAVINWCNKEYGKRKET